MIKSYLSSSIGKKQIVAITGIAMVLFLIAHLGGNLLLYVGPEAFNAYAYKLKSLGALLWVARIGLIVTALLHVVFTYSLVIANRKARGGRYAKDTHGGSRSLSTRLMPVTGTILLAYIVTHLLDYTLADHHTVQSFINGQDLGLYGLVINSFKMSLPRVVWYVVAMGSVGFHLTHGIQSVFRTFGIYHSEFTPLIDRVSVALGLILALGFASIPLYVGLVM